MNFSPETVQRYKSINQCCLQERFDEARRIMTEAGFNEERLARAAVMEGYLAILQWLDTTGAADSSFIRRNFILWALCWRGHLEAAQWVVSRYGLTADDVIDSDDSALCGSARAGHVTIVQWLVVTFKLPLQSAVRALTVTSNLAVITWMVDHFGVTVENAGAEIIGAFWMACSDGAIATTAWLTERFSLTARDVQDESLRRACNNGRLPMVQWLVARFGLVVNYTALAAACRNGHLATAAWLVDDFGLTGEYLRADDFQILHDVMIYERMDMLVWLNSRTPITAEDINGGLFVELCSRGRTAAVQWLINQLGAKLNITGGIAAATKNDRTEIASMLAEKLKINFGPND